MPDNPFEQPGRVLLLLPDLDVHEPRLAQAIAKLQPRRSSVTVLSLITTNNVENRTSLRIALLSAVLRDAGMAVTVHVIRGTDWVQQTRKLHHKNDLVMCLREHIMADSIGLQQRMHPIHSYLLPLGMNPVVVSGIASKPMTRAAQTMQDVRQLVLPALIFLAFSGGQIALALSPMPEMLTRISLLGSAVLELAFIGYLFS